MAMFEKQGSPFLFDEDTKDIVALRDPDGSYTPILTPSEVMAARDLLSAPKKNGNILNIRNLATRKIVWWGDSTIENASTSCIPYVAGTDQRFYALPGVTTHINYGASGASTTAILAAAEGTANLGGNIYTPGGVGNECKTAALLIISFGINDYRALTSIGNYSDANWRAAVKSVQANLARMAGGVRAVSPNIPIVFMVPHPIALSDATYITGGVGGQIITNTIRATYLGDTFYGIPALDSLVANSVVVDSGGAVFGEISFATSALPSTMSDALHPTPTGYLLRHLFIAEWLNSLYAKDEYVTMCNGVVINSASTYFDIVPVDRVARLFGNTASVSYGTAKEPQLGRGDIMFVTNPDGSRRRIRFSAQPYQNASEYYIRWVSAPDGSWHETDILPGASVSFCRRRVASVFDAYALRLPSAYKIYPIRVTAGASGSCTIKGVPGGDCDLAQDGYAPLVTDLFCHAATGGGLPLSASMGKALTGATITATGNPGEFTIALSGTDFTYAANQIGSIIVLK